MRMVKARLISKPDLSKNRILAALPEKTAKRLSPHLRSISFGSRDVLFEVGDAINYIYFPLDAVVSPLILMHDGRSAAVSLAGNEGLVGLPSAILGMKTAPWHTIVQIPGAFLKIEAAALQTEFRRCDVLHDRVLRYTRFFLAEISQTAACNGLHGLEERLARWLLMLHSRVGKDEFPITHEHLSDLLGASRSEVTRVAGSFRKAKLIRYSHGKVTILDRMQLESASCECYQIEL
jgi:CRP-like cAMP-binding protein